MNAKSQSCIRIFDTTLRDGEQTPGVSLTFEDKIEIARQLSLLGVDAIEAGFPASSEGEKKVVKEIASAGLKTEVCGLARANKADIDAAIECDVDAVHVFIPTSPVQMKYAISMTPEQVVAATTDSVEYIKKHGLTCEFSPMDATRSESRFLKQVCQAAQKAGMDRLNVPDTVGVMIPKTMSKLIEDLKAVITVPISVHCHDDFGMAVANSLAAVEAGAAQVHATINGLGERAGNASLEEVVMALHMIYKIKTGINTRLLYSTSRLVSTLTGITVQANKAIVGENAFAHESGIHQDAILKKRITYEIMDPRDVGISESSLVLGKHSGRHALDQRLKVLGFNLDEDRLSKTFQRFKELADKKKNIFDDDLISIVEDETKVIKPVWVFDSFEITSGTKISPIACVSLRYKNKIISAKSSGDGPVDACFKAIDKATGVKGQLQDYRIEAVTKGKDALGEVSLKLKAKERVVTARGSSTDIIEASIRAYINALNKIESL